jgi:hypothetical protein
MTKFTDWNDRLNLWILDDVAEIVRLVKDYCDAHGYKNVRLDEVETGFDDKNKRKDITIFYTDDYNCSMMQRLLILNGELIDGKEFHKRIKEFYPEHHSGKVV